jgi:Ca-activated chloride channel family protein
VFKKNIWLFLIIVLSFIPQTRSASQPQTQAGEQKPPEPLHETVEVSYVNVTITALDSHGRYVNDLRPEEFVIEEDDVPQKISDFSHYTPEQAIPRSIGFLVDNSGSMSGEKNSIRKLDLAIASARRILTSLNPGDSLSFLPTNGGVGPKPDISSGDAIPSVLDQINVHGGVTLLLDSLLKLIQHMADQPGRRFIVVCSDGQDNGSKTKTHEILLRAHNADLTIISVGTIESEIAKEWGEDAKREQQNGKKLLQKLADDTGGLTFFPTKAEDVTVFPEELNRLLASQYYVSYRSTNQSTPGWRRITVKCTRRSVKELYYRKGYIAKED